MVNGGNCHGHATCAVHCMTCAGKRWRQSLAMYITEAVSSCIADRILFFVLLNGGNCHGHATCAVHCMTCAGKRWRQSLAMYITYVWHAYRYVLFSKTAFAKDHVKGDRILRPSLRALQTGFCSSVGGKKFAPTS